MRVSRLRVVGALLALVVAACSGAAEPETTATEPGEARPGGTTSVAQGWSRIDLDPESSGEGSIADVTPGGPGLVAVGVETDRGARDIVGGTVWLSSDGLSWERLLPDEEVFPPGSWLEAVTAGGPGLVAVGTVPAEEGEEFDRDAAIWVSEDGTAWHRVPHDPELFGNSGRVWDVVVGPEGLVAVGTRFREGFETTVWFSPGGLEWEQVAVLKDTDLKSLAVGGPGVAATGAVLNEEGHFVVGMWTSRDGRDWTLVHQDDEVSATLEVVGAGGPGLVAIGGASPAVVWISPDGTDWTKRAELEGAEVRTLTPGGPGLVAAGTAAEGGAGAAAVWFSVDGVTWTRVPHDEAVFGGETGILGLTAGGPGLVAVGSVFTDHEAPAIWVWDASEG